MNSSPSEEIVGRIQEALELAGNTLKPFSSGSIKARYKMGNELVTEADHAVNNVLHRVLQRNSEGWLSEESFDDRSRLEHENVWVVDPIDGTQEFVARIPEWCVSIAYVRQGVAVAGGIMNPATQETFLGSAATGLFYNGRPVPRGARDTLTGATVLASRSEVRRGEWEVFRDVPFTIIPMGSVAYKLARVAAGLADATWTLTPKHEWDVAAGVALIESGGGFVQTLDFVRPTFNRSNALLRGLMASTPKLGIEILAFLRPHISAPLVPADSAFDTVDAENSAS